MLPQVQTLRDEARRAIAECRDITQLQQLDAAYLGRKGSVTLLLKGIKDVAVEERKAFGQDVNALKDELANEIAERQKVLIAAKAAAEVEFDITLPGKQPQRGSLHPTLKLQDDLNDAFLSLGFSIFEGPEISSEAACFDNLNFPEDHPARESMDTFWISGSENKRGAERLALRPHLTGASVRYMLEHKPPFRFVYPGQVYRNESTDPGHERGFFQYEALIVDKKVPFSSGRLLVNTILERIFGQRVKTRMRAGFFPFVEPGFEIDMQCLVCAGKGCSVCKRVGWLEMMPGGPPHPNVLRAGGIDPNEWQGFYINIGSDRLTMMRHSIDDIRPLHGAELRVLRQFA